MPSTNYERNRTLDRAYGGVDYTVPATVYIGLFTRGKPCRTI